MDGLLYDQGGNPTERLNLLRTEDIPLTITDVAALWVTYCEGCEWADDQPTMMEFGAWLVGKANLEPYGYQTSDPAEVLW